MMKSPDEPPRTSPCSHCGEAVPGGRGVCANCGALLGGVWPPPPEGRPPLPPPPLPPPPPPTLTGRAWADFGLGAAAQYLTHLATARTLVRYVPTAAPAGHSRDWMAQGTVPGSFVLCEIFWAVLLGLLLYYGVRRFYPAVARGSGYTTLALLAVLLGAFFTCRPLLY